jgi:nucleoside-diphosphate-sugar epimerase
MNIVVTGATGNVGTALVERLAEDPDGPAVLGLARRLPGHRPPHGVRYEAVDVATDDLVTPLRGADVVVHLAWHFQPTHDPEHTWAANAIGSARLLEACATAQVPAVIVASSVGAYSPVDVGDDVPRDETWPTHSSPTSCYGREKAYVERVLDAFEARHPEVRVVRMRPAFILARRAASEQRRIFAGPFVPNWLVTKGLLPVLPWPRGLRLQALHADDVAEAYRLAITKDVRGAFNLAAPPVIDGAAFAELLHTKSRPVPPRLVRSAVAAAWHLRLAPTEPSLFDLAMRVPLLDTSRARDLLGWYPRHDARDAINELIEGLRAGAGGTSAPLAPDSLGHRVRELSTRVGGRDDTGMDGGRAG